MNYYKSLYLHERVRYILSDIKTPEINKSEYEYFISKNPLDEEIFLKTKKQELNLGETLELQQLFSCNKNIDIDHKWISFFEESFEQFTVSLPQSSANEKAFYLTPLYPLLKNAVKKLLVEVKRGEFDLDLSKKSLVNSFFEDLSIHVYELSLKTLVLNYNIEHIQNNLEGKNDKEKLIYFLKSFKNKKYRTTFFNQYPILARLVSELCLNKIRNTVLMLERLNRDRKEIKKSLIQSDKKTSFKLIGFKSLGDSHENNNSVSVLQFNHDIKIIYKPRPVKIHKEFYRLIKFLNKNFKINLPYKFNIIDKDRYGWCEYVNHEPCSSIKEIKDYFFNLGFLQALLYFLNGTDIHYENLIAYKNFPVIIDLECLFHPSYNNLANPKNLDDSVISSCVLPTKIKFGNNFFNFGASEKTDGQKAILGTPRLNKKVRKGTSISYHKKVSDSTKHLPSIGAKSHNIFDHSSIFKKGFKKCYNIFLSNKKSLTKYIIDNFSGLKVRALFRYTLSYSHLLKESTHPDYLRNGISRELIFEYLRDIPKDSYLKKLIKYEIKDLLNNDIPIFYFKSDKNYLLDSNGEVIQKKFAFTNGLQKATSKIANCSTQDLKFQTFLIDLIINNYNRFGIYKIASNQKDKNQFIGLAKNINEILSCYRFRTTNNELTWINTHKNTDKIQKADYNLYKGYLGVIFYYSYLYKITKNPNYKKIVLDSLDFEYLYSTAKNDNRLGLFNGISGIIYTFSHLFKIFGYEEFLIISRKLSSKIISEISDLKQNDIIKGISGCLLAIYSLSKIDNKNSCSYKEKIDYCAQTLINRAVRENDIAFWKSKNMRKPLGGFSHGTSGISIALYRAFLKTNRKEYCNYIHAALQYENKLFRRKKENWVDMRFYDPKNPEKETFQYSWCNGAAGIGFNRLILRELDIDINLQNDLDIAVQTILKNGFGNNHCLCHGDFGNLDLLLSVSLTTKNKNLKAKTIKAAENCITTIYNEGLHTGSNNQSIDIGIMTGVSGVAYQLLRLSNPKQIPSILTLEPPK